MVKAERGEPAKLRHENKRVQIERDSPRKASAFFAKESA